jgi:hypothetical protein
VEAARQAKLKHPAYSREVLEDLSLTSNDTQS